jgi:hypothetical protein
VFATAEQVIAIITSDVVAEFGDGVRGFVENDKLIPVGTPEDVRTTGLLKLFHD